MTARKTTAAKKPAAKRAATPRKTAASKRLVADVELPDTEPDAAERLAAEATPPAKPEGAPELVDMATLPRRQRANMLRVIARVQGSDLLQAENVEELERLDTATEADQAAAAADLIEIAADVEELLAVVAVDKVAYDQWAAAATETDLFALLGWYMAVHPVGEAEASPT